MKEIGASRAPEDPSTEKLGAGARVNGLPDAEVERHLHAGLLVVVCVRDCDLDRDPLGMRFDLAEIRDTVGTTEEADELIGQARVTQSDVHRSPTLCDA
jgi:hypothetical protein